MTATVAHEDVALFKQLVARKLGLQFEESRQGQLAELLERRLQSTRKPAAAYLACLQDVEDGGAELRALARELTVSETYFFRNIEQLRAFVDVAVPDRMRAHPERRELRILSAGCASGEEPLSLAMLMSERAPDPSWRVSIKAVDFNPFVLERAARGHYAAWALRETPEPARRRWFRPAGTGFSVDDSIRAAVTFEERNLVEPNADLWRPAAYDVVFCRNLLMYFTREHAQRLVSRIAHALAPGGYLFLGHAETLRGLSQDFHLRHTHGTFYYRRRSALAGELEPAAAEELSPECRGLTAAVDEGGTWIATIQKASDRIQALAESSTRPLEPNQVAGSAQSSAKRSLTSAIELLKAEQFGEALDVVHAIPPESAHDPDVLLLRATLLTHRGNLREAERCCEELLGRDELNAGAHYLLALCREGQDDAKGAREHDEIAVYLDARFAMPRLHMGLLARRAGDRERARQELSAALELVHGEEPGRLLLFGGGFTRDALAGMCRAELAACGGAG